MKIVERVTSGDMRSATVEHVVCEQCRSLIAFVLSNVDPDVYGDSKIAVPIAGQLLAVRERLDKTPDGDPMLGLQCACGNDTRLSEAELHHEPKDGWRLAQMTNAEKQRISAAIADCEDHKPDFEHNSRTTRYESFSIKRV